MTGPISPQRLEEIDIAIGMFRQMHPGSFGEMVAEVRAELERLTGDVLTLKTQRVQTQDAYCDLADYCHAMELERDQARKRLAELDAEVNEAFEHLHRLVDDEDDDCAYDHHGTCQTHWVNYSQPGKCGMVEIREWLAAHDPAETDTPTGDPE